MITPAVRRHIDVVATLSLDTSRSRLTGNNGGCTAPALWGTNSPVTPVRGESTDMQYVRPFDPDKAVDAGFPRFRAQVLSHLEAR